MGKEILRAFFLWKNGIEWLGFFASSTLLLSLLLGKLAFYLMDLLRCVVIVTYLFFLSRGEDTRASASCPSNTTSKQAVSSEGESGDSDLGVEIFRSSWRPLLPIVLLRMMAGVGLIHPCCKVYSEFVMTCVVLIVWLLLLCFILRRCGWARPMAAPSGREAIALIRVFGGCCDAGEAGWW